ncbi:pentatricopeptide repeat-containing protein At2g17525, mitochondrial isoform X2 [Andrographis paniculata]|uniref:pentatricopeptide repeat-containing protein At2g17525, mitochondrial isoform X2 n=1 Tax=Andrographis paniculata TaxID=175694 RepID=UPI0021E8B1AD|nr:pentatricopeptide repeat-containing protein At2g17525, mitochondrial isoform X2 [Andrographis paniculata]XP_051146898.1 pentatricopeptide repeat-containing protein At2g17525, mitochondrial isoform X2 [Andrographis paniculata]
MLAIFDISKLIKRSRLTLLFSSTPSRFFSTFTPSHQKIADLILEQKSSREALQTFQWATKIPNFTHTLSTCRALLHKLCTFRKFIAVQQLLEEIPKIVGLPLDDDTFITVARGYGRARMTREVVRVLDLVPMLGKGSPSLKLLNTVLDILVMEDIDIAREFYRKKMMLNGVKGDDYTYGILMKGFCVTNRIGDGFKLLQVLKSHGIKVNVVVYNTLIYALCKNGKLGRARSLMHEMKELSDVTFNILISAYCDANNLVQALVMLEKCFNHGFVPDVVTLTKVVEIMCHSDRLWEAVEVLERVEGKGGTLDVVAYNTLLKGFVKAGKAGAAHGFLKQMELKGCLPNTETYNVVISGFCATWMLDSAIETFYEMQRMGVPWNFFTFDTLIHGLCSSGRTKDGFIIFRLMMENEGWGCDGRIGPYNSILYGLYRDNNLYQAYKFLKYMERVFPHAVNQSSTILHLCEKGNVEEAKQVLDGMREGGDFSSVIVYASVIQGLCKKGCTREGVELMNEMVRLGYFPVASTFNSLLDGLCRQGKVGSALRLLEDLKMRGCLPDSESYALVINAMCIQAQGELCQVLKVLVQMVERGIAPDYCTWNAVIMWKFNDMVQKDALLLLQRLTTEC